MEFPHLVLSLLLSLSAGSNLDIGANLRNFSSEGGRAELLPPFKFGPPSHCPGNITVCTFDDVENFSKENAMKIRQTITKLLNILEMAAQTTGLVKGKLFSSEELDKKTRLGLLSRNRRDGGLTSLCCEKVVPNEYPEIGKDEKGQWRYLVRRHVVDAAYCMHEGNACSAEITLDSPHEVSRCVQKFGSSPMVVFDQDTQKFETDHILVPCGCQCQFGKG